MTFMYFIIIKIDLNFIIIILSDSVFQIQILYLGH